MVVIGIDIGEVIIYFIKNISGSGTFKREVRNTGDARVSRPWH